MRSPLLPWAVLLSLAARPALADPGIDESLEEGAEPTARAAPAAPVDLWPASTTVWTGDELIARGYRTLGTALGDLAGVERIQTTLGPRYAIRGVVGGLLLVVDGVPEILTGEQDVLDLDSGLDLGEVQRVEVVHGSVSALNGVSALAGVVRVTTRAAGLTGAAAHAAVTGLGEAEVRGSGTWRRGELAVRASFFERTGPDAPWQLNFVPIRFAGIGRSLPAVAFDSLDAQPDDDRSVLARVTATYRDFRLDASLTRTLLHVPLSTFSHGLLTDPEQSQTRGRERLELFWSHAFGRLSMTAVVFAAHHEGLDDIPLYPVGASLTHSGDLILSSLSRTAGALLRAQWLLAPEHRLVFSAFGTWSYQDAHSDAVDPFSTAPPSRQVSEDGEVTAGTLAAEYQGDFGRGWHATAGLAAERHTSYGSSAAPRLAVVYFPRPALSARLTYSEGTRAADPFDLTALTQAVVAGQVVGAEANTTLQPERTRTGELAATFHPSSSLELQLATFGTRLEDGLSAQLDGGRWEPINLSARWIAGGEATASAEFADGRLRLWGGASWARTVRGPADEGDVGLLAGAMELKPRRTLTLGVRGHATYRPATSQVPGWGERLDIYGGWQFSSSMRLLATLRNTLDTNEPSPDLAANPLATPVAIGSPARSGWVSLEAAW